MLAEAAIAKADELEVIALGSLIRNSEHAKLLISRLINRTIEELGDPEIKPRDRALGLGALAGVIKLVYRWHEEPSVSEMQHAQNGMINLTLQATLPYDLKRLALARTGSLATQHDDQGGGPCPDGEDFSGPDSPSGFAGNYGNRRRLCARLLFGITRGHKPERHGDCFLFFTASEANSKCDIAQTAQEVAKRAFASTVLLVMEDANEQPLSLGSGSVSVMGR